MTSTGLAFGYVLLLWWASTGIILYLDGLPRRTFRWTILGATLLLAAGLAGLVASRDAATVGGALAAFTAALAVWGWNEVLFLTGYVTGPNRRRCPEDASGGRRFRLAAAAVMHHEIGLALSAIVVVGLTGWAANPVAAWTFAVLWIMRLSAKLNIYLGVPNVGAEFLPDHLAYLASFFRRAPMNPLFPASVILGAGALAVLIAAAAGAEPASHARIGATLVATLLGLALVEHLFMVLPMRSADLWRWGFASHAATGAPRRPGSPDRGSEPRTTRSTDAPVRGTAGAEDAPDTTRGVR